MFIVNRNVHIQDNDEILFNFTCFFFQDFNVIELNFQIIRDIM